MKKIIVIVILLITIAYSGLTQGRQPEIDSLKYELVMARQDTTRVLVMVSLCANYRLSNPDSALFYGQQALTLAKQIKFPKGEILALTFESYVMRSIGNLPKALEMGLKALQVAEENQLQKNTAATLNSVGGIYRTLGDLPQALTYFKQQLIVGSSLPDKTGLAYAESAIGRTFEEMDQLDSSSYYLKKSLEHFNMIGRADPGVFRRLGRIEMKSGDPSLALDYYQKSLEVSVQNDEPTRTSQTYNDISELYKRIDQTDSSIYYAKKGLALAEQTSQIRETMESASLLSDLFEPTDAKQALRYHKIAMVARDSLYGSTNIQAVQVIAAQEEDRQKEMEAAKIAYQNQLKQYAFLAGLVALLLIAFVLYRNNRKKLRANLLLQQQKEEIDMQRDKAEKALDDLQATQSQLIHSEKMASLGELTAGIAHEIQNPLNFVNNFSEVNTELIEEMETEIVNGDLAEVKALAKSIKENEQKIVHHGQRADAIVKSMLHHSRRNKGEKELTVINALADEYLRLAYHGMRAKDPSFNVELKTDFDASLEKVKIIPQEIGRVVLNLITNAFHACKERSRSDENGYIPEVSISTKKLDDGLQITVKDNGGGIPKNILDKIFQPFFTTKPTGEGTGLGLSLSYDIVKAHGGKMKVETEEGKGSEFIIKLPI